MTDPSHPSPSGSNVASGSISTQVQQVGSRQGTRSRSRTARKASGTSTASSVMGHPLPRYSSEDHPLAAHKLAARGYHSFTCLGVPFHVPKRYTFLRELGIGAYGCVALARDEELEMNVAIKKVTRVFERDVLARRALREVAILRHMLKNQNCTALIDFDTTFIDFSEVYLVLSASEADLSQIIRSGQALSDAHLQYFAAQLLRGVRYMHAANVIHRDLKPGNLLVNADCALFICDFGLARAFADGSDGKSWPSKSERASSRDRSETVNEAPNVDSDPPSTELGSQISPKNALRMEPPMSKDAKTVPVSPAAATVSKPSKIRTTRLAFPGGPLTEYVSTRWYRAPEIMLGFKEGYGPEIDMWSVGCILAELASGKPLFDGKDYVDQIARIHGVLGPPSRSVLDRISSERAKVYVESLPKDSPPLPLRKILKTASPGLIDLLEQLLVWDPQERLSAEEALRHPWLSAYHGIIDQWEKPEPFSKFDEIELIDSLSEFRGALQTEADEVKGEYAALFGGGEDDAGSSSGSAAEDFDSDGKSSNRVVRAGINPKDARSTAPVSSSTTQDSTPLRQVPGQDTYLGGDCRGDSIRNGARELQQSSSSSASSTSLRRMGESSSEEYTTDTCSPLTSVGESASLSSSSEGSHFGIGSARHGNLPGHVSKQRSFTMTTVKGDEDASGKPQTLTPHAEGLTRRLSRPSTLRTSSACASSSRASLFPSSCDSRENTTSAVVSSTAPRYRRRAISNAPRPVPADGSETISASGPRCQSPSRRTVGSDSIAMNASAEVAALSLPGLQDGDLAGVPPATLVPSTATGQFEPQHQAHTPSPDFRTFTTDLISRPKYELGAFASPALDAGDAVTKSLVQKRLLAAGGGGAGKVVGSVTLEVVASSDRNGGDDAREDNSSKDESAGSDSTIEAAVLVRDVKE